MFNQVNVVTKDMDASLAFYRLLGMEVGPAVEWPDGSGWLHVNTEGQDAARLEWDNEGFARVWAPEWQDPKGVVLGFSLPTREAVDETHRRVVDAGYVGLQSPYDAFWGARYAVVQDPDGNAVGLMSPIDPAARYDLGTP